LWNGSEGSYGTLGDEEVQWRAGDVIGCLLHISGINTSPLLALSYSLNGKDLGHAFTSTDAVFLHSILHHPSSTTPSSTTITASPSIGLYPALTLEQGESLIVNIGQRPFRYPPSHVSGLIPVNSALDPSLTQSITDPEVSLSSILALVTSGMGKPANTDVGKSVKADEPVSSEAISTSFDPINLDDYSSVDDICQLGLNHLKAELTRRGLKAGGNLRERAERLFTVRGVPDSKVSEKLKAKKG
jgi:hypothetical protein